MNEDKLKELETKFPYHKEVIELITTYRQLEKDNKALDEKHDDCIDSLCDAADEYFKMKEANAELQAALKPFAHLKGRSMVTVPNDLRFAEQVYNKHKGE